jgi:hypothetical protein
LPANSSPAVASQLITGCCQPTHHWLLPANSSLGFASQLERYSASQRKNSTHENLHLSWPHHP